MTDKIDGHPSPSIVTQISNLTEPQSNVYAKISPNHIVKVNNSWKYETVRCEKDCKTGEVVNNIPCDCDVFTKFKNKCKKHDRSSFTNRGLLLIFKDRGGFLEGTNFKKNWIFFLKKAPFSPINVNFSKASKLGTRNGSEKDVKALQDIFTCLGYKVVIKRDSSIRRMVDICNRIAELEMLKEHTALFVAILSHGEKNDFVYGSYGNAVQIDDLIEPFRGSNCPGLAGKPKIFLVNACRGTQFDDGVTARLYENLNNSRNGRAGKFTDATGRGITTRSMSSDRARNLYMTDSTTMNYTNIKIPHTADVLVAFSCFSGYYSWRNQREGSWFVQALCQGLRDANFDDDDFQRILTKASVSVAFNMESNTNDDIMNKKKQVPCIVSTLTKCLFFE